MAIANFISRPRVTPPLEEDFLPLAAVNRNYQNAVRASGRSVPLVIGLEREEGHVTRYATEVFAPQVAEASANLWYAERLVKTLLWQRGGCRVLVAGPREIADHLAQVYGPGGPRAFDAEFMAGVYECPFSVEWVEGDIVASGERPVMIGRHLDGCRIGFDAGASDRKVAAVVEGEVVFSEEVVWNPRAQADPDYHYREINAALKAAAAHMPRVDAIGVSAAGIYINNRVAVASLFRGVPKPLFDSKVKNLFLRLQQEWKVPLEVANDGDVTALAGAMSLRDNAVLGIAMGSSEAGGYVDTKGNLTTRLNELAFVPFDANPDAPMDEWSGDRGVGAQYFSQTGVVRLAPRAGIELDPTQTPAEQLKAVQDLLAQGDVRARRVFETLGCELGYAIAHYADFYHFRHVLVLGRVTSGEGGAIMLDRAREVINVDFPSLRERCQMHLPDETSKRVGQAVAAASLPAIPR